MKKTKKILSVVLAGMMLASSAAVLSGCGSGGGNKTTADEYVYVPEYIKITGADNVNINNVRYANKQFYFSTSGNDGGRGGKVMIDTAGGVTTSEAKAEPASSTDAESGTAIYSLGLDGAAKKLSYYKPSAAPKGKQGSVNLAAYDVDASGNLYVVEEAYTYHFDLPAGFSGTEDNKYQYQVQDGDTFTLTKYGTDGKVVYQTNLTELCSKDKGANDANDANGANGVYVSSVKCDSKGNVYFINNQSVYALDTSGKLFYKYDSTGWFDQLAMLPDGRIAVTETTQGAEGVQPSDGSSTTSSNLMVMDNTKKAATVLCKLTSAPYGMTTGNATYGAIYTNGAYLYGLNTATGTAATILNWLNCNIDSDNISGVACLDDGRIACVSNEYNQKTQTSTPELALLTKTKASDASKKKVLTLATQYLDYNLKGEVLDFNKTNPDYRIEVTDYSQYNTDKDYDAGLKKMTTEILTGNVPDIIFTQGINVEQFVAKGIVTDLDKFMASDKTVTKKSIMDNVLASMEINGKLYEAAPSFFLYTVMGNPSVVGSKMGWTVDDLNAAFKKMPEGSTIFDETVTRPDILNTCLAMDMDEFVNWSTGECSFDKGGFQKLLEFAKSFPSDFDWKNYDWQNYKDPSVRIAAGKQMLMQAYIGQLSDYSMYKTEFGGKLNCVGFPTATGVGNMVSFQGGYAISAKCANPDGAWQFVRTFLTKDYQQKDRSYGLPTNKDAFNDAMKTAMTKTYKTDENGKTVLDKNGNKVEQPIGNIYISQDKSIDYYALTQADKDELMTVINAATKVLRYDQSIVDIITDESNAYFKGEKSAEETAKLVQSRVSIYVNEQS